MTLFDPTLSDALADAAVQLCGSTVQVRGRGPGGGSGVIWQRDGLIVTNAHVAHDDEMTVELAGGRTLPAQLVARDPERDLAALQIDASDLPAVSVSDSSALRVGQLVVAAGNPLGMVGAVTVGIIHAIAPVEGRGRANWVQADVHLAPGNSGGPLADAAGRVIGINSMVAGGLGLAVPSNAVERFLASKGERAQLGVTLQPVLVPARRQNKAATGLLVLEVASGSTAEEAGLIVGDIVVGIDGRDFSHPRDLLEALQVPRGAILHLDLIRGGTRVTRQVSLSDRKVPEDKAA